MSKRRFSAFLVKVTVLTSVLSILLMPAIALAEEKAKKGEGDGLILGQLKSLFGTVWNWIGPMLTPDTEWEYWWIILLTIPFTFVWQLKADEKIRDTFNKIGGIVVFGGAALAVLLMFVGPFLAVVMVIIGLVSSVIGLSLNLSLKGIFTTIWSIIKLIPFFFVVWLVTKIPGLQGLIERWINLGKSIAGRIWSQRLEVEKNPSPIWMVIGGLVVALLINGKFAMHLTEDFAFSGLIPGASAGVGFFYLIWRTVLGNKLKQAVAEKAHQKVSDKPLANGDEFCTNSGMRLMVKLIKGKYVTLLDSSGNKRYEFVKRCGHKIKKGEKFCGHNQCDQPKYFVDWDCPNCGKKGLEWDTEKCPNCRQKKPMRPWCCPKCRYNGETGKGIKWKLSQCPKCGTQRPKFPTTPFHHPDEDSYQSPVAPAAPAQAPARAAPAATPPIADGWQCTAMKLAFTPAGKRMPLLDDNGRIVMRNGVPVQAEEPCGQWNAKDAQQCGSCGTPKAGAQPGAQAHPVGQQAQVHVATLPEPPMLDPQPCPNCGDTYDAACDNCCANCGLEVKANGSAQASAPAKPKATSSSAASSRLRKTNRGGFFLS